MKRRMVFAVQKVLAELSHTQQNVKFAYFIAKNLRLANDECRDVLESLNPTKEYIDSGYDQERLELGRKYADKDENGKYKTDENKHFIFSEKNRAIFDKELEKLQKKHKKVVDARNKQLSDYDKMMDEEVEIQFHKIKLADLPQQMLPHQLSVIMELVNEK